MLRALLRSNMSTGFRFMPHQPALPQYHNNQPGPIGDISHPVAHPLTPTRHDWRTHDDLPPV